jgi:hypothetical protein
VIISNYFHILYNFLNVLIMSKCWNAMWVGLWRNSCNVIVFELHIGFISSTANPWRNLMVVIDAVWSLTKSMTKLAQRHSIWTSYRASYPALRIYDEIWLFVMDAMWSMTKSKNVMRISSWIKGILVVYTAIILHVLGTVTCYFAAHVEKLVSMFVTK